MSPDSSCLFASGPDLHLKHAHARCLPAQLRVSDYNENCTQPEIYFAQAHHPESLSCTLYVLFISFLTYNLLAEANTHPKKSHIPELPSFRPCNYQVAAMGEKRGYLMGTRNLRKKGNYIWHRYKKKKNSYLGVEKKG